MPSSLPQQVYDHYWNSLNSLTAYTFFHFVSRLYLLKNDRLAENELQKIFSKHPVNITKSDLIARLNKYLTNPSLPASKDRQEYLLKYPILRPFARSAFIVLFGRAIWQVDLFQEEMERWSKEELAIVYKNLLADPDAIRCLATYGLNYLVLYAHFFDKKGFHQLVLKLYELVDERWEKMISADFQTLVYFVTHMIINDSLFYTRQVSEERRLLHRRYLEKIENTLSEGDLTDLSNDCLCEMQLCFKMLGMRSKLFTAVQNHVEQCISPSGTYIVEPNDVDKNLSEAEHTNVLYLLNYYYE